MKKIIALVTFILSFNAHAGLISINLSDTEVVIGEKIQVDIIANDITTDLFNFDLNFDTSLFSYDSTSFNSDITPLDPFSYAVTEFPSGLTFSYFGIFEPILTIADASNFVLASFELTASAVGTSNFSFSNIEFYEPFAFNLSDIDSDSMSITSVPEPQTVILFGLAILMSLVQHQRLKK